MCCALLGGLLALPPAGVVSAAPRGGARVQGPVRLGVLPLRVEGRVDEATRTSWVAGLRGGLSRGSAPLVDEVALAQALAGCVEQECLDRARESGATHAVRGGVAKQSRDFLLELEVVDLATGEVVVRSAETCEICGVAEVTELLDSQGALLQTRLEALGKEPPADTRWAPGSPRQRALGWAALGGGVGLFGAGVTLLALDDRPYKKRCTGADRDAEGDCRWVFKTSWGGAALAVTGAVLVTLGIVALVRNRALRTKRMTVLPTGLGLVARF